MAKLLLLPKKLLAPCSGACVGGRRGWEAWCSDSHAGWQGGAGWGGARRGGRGEGRGGERAAEAGTCSGGRDLSRLDLCELFVPKRPRVVSHTVLAPRAWPALGQARVLLFDGHERRQKVVSLETRAKKIGDRPGADGGRASVSRAGWVRGGKQRPCGRGERMELKAAPPPTRVRLLTRICARCRAPRHRVARSPPARVVHPSVARQLDLERAAPPCLGGLAMPRAAGHVHRGREAAAQQGPSALHLHWRRSTELFRGQQPSVPAEFAVKTCSRPWSRCAVAGVCVRVQSR